MMDFSEKPIDERAIGTKRQELSPDKLNTPSFSAHSTLEFSTVGQQPNNTSSSPYLPHLAIYDHLPRNSNIFADTAKYQKWATTILPRIASPKHMIGKKGFAIRPNPGQSDYGLSPDIITVSPLHYRQNQGVNGKPFSPRRKKVRPGLVKGCTMRQKTMLPSKHQDVSNDVKSIAKTKTPYTESERSAISTSLSMAFDKMTTETPQDNYRDTHLPHVYSSLSSGRTLSQQDSYKDLTSDVKRRKRNNRQFLSLTKSVNGRSSPQESSNGDSMGKVLSSLTKGNSSIRFGIRTTSCLNITLNTPRKEKTIPSFTDLNNSFAEELSPCITTVQVPT